jgi:hypothetical protein
MDSNPVAPSKDRHQGLHPDKQSDVDPDYTYTVNSKGHVTPTTTVDCWSPETFQFQGHWPGAIYAIRDGIDKTVEVFGEPVVVRTALYTVQQTAPTGKYRITTNPASCGTNEGGGDTGGAVGHIKVGSPTMPGPCDET